MKLVVKNPPVGAVDARFYPWVRKIPWRKAWQSTPVLLPGESHGKRNLVAYSPWGCKESDITEHNMEEEMATHCNILAWKIPWTEEPGRLQSMGLQRVGHD